ncbi:MAG: DUF488 domain-containing protein [Planctomycetota bacterium]|jgi:uncharacterized protein (DUF488 family)
MPEARDEGGTAVYSVGHGSRTFGELDECLRSFGVRTLADVRSFPTSRRHPQFDQEALERALTESGVAYRWLGRELGGFRSDGYEAHTRTDLFREGIGRLAALAEGSTAAFMCAERDPAGCHRRFIARELAGRGFTVHHIIEPGRVLLPGERPEDQGTLFPLS